ncbi:ABC transporter ATP-binding protein [Clostridium sp. A1-XYC3]|uniref:ABC transporter ATP-binding protein n=1 Tax=Clostridium tanneri TaxID=3037988 RepID=A0ABU4JV37_9CLOT|nr:ABC transporter ATP-binding protein [Clostridium sp. A1-XYC3]MDW8802016.1 ABC transporter ATP-binding protein [Clostridium sp. A1-XYC3]
MKVLLVQNVKTYYGNIQALKEVSLEIREGEIVTLIGGNGAGKTTTLKTIAGLLRPREGKIIFNSKDITGIPAHKVVSESVVLVPEGRRVFSKLTVEENLQIGAYCRKEKKNKLVSEIKEIYNIFPRLEERKKQYAGTLSGGEQQMLAIGRGLMAKPKLLLLDEPSMGVAPIVVKEIFQVIKKINQELRTTVFLVEQNAKMALAIADRGYVLETGKITLQGTTEELKESEEVKRAYLGV